MINAGLPVPGGFHVTTQAYRDFVSTNQLQAPILAALQKANAADPSSLELVSREINQRFIDGHMPEEIADAIRQAYAALNDAPVACAPLPPPKTCPTLFAASREPI
jgi:pyruvate,water dikinase